MLIGQLSSESGFSKDTIRYYEKIGVIQPSGYIRKSNNYKSYSDKTLKRLLHIRQLKDAGFTLSEITDLLDTFNNGISACSGLPQNLTVKIAEIDEKISLLESYKRSLQNIANACNSRCALDDGLPTCMRA